MAPKKSASEESGLPSWAKTKPVDGVLAIPSTVGTSLKKQLGPLARPIVPSVRFVATQIAGTWGLGRQLHLTSGGGAGIAKTLAVLAASELPILQLDLRASVGATGEIKLALAGPAIAQVSSFTLGLAEPLGCAPLLANAIGQMPRLQSLHIVAKGGGEGVLSLVEAAPPLRSLKLVSVGLTGADLKRLSKARALQGLETLQLLHVQASDEELATLFSSSWARTSIKSLALSRAEKLPIDYSGLGELEAIRDLDLGFISPNGLAAIAEARFMPDLVSLKLHGTKVTSEVAIKLAANELRALEVLHLKWAEADGKAIDILVKAAPKLRLLEVPSGVKAQKSWVKKGRQIL